MRESLIQVWKTTKRKPSFLAEAPPMPEELQYIWDLHREVFTGEPLTYGELESWSNMTGKSLQGWEAELIRSIDRIFWKVQNGHRSSKASSPS